MGLAALAKGDANAAQMWISRRSRSKLADRQSWAFQGRELVEALFVRTSIAAKETERAIERQFVDVCCPSSADASAVTWLLADCMPTLFKAGGFVPTSILAKGSSAPASQGKRISIPGSQARVTT